MLKLSRNDGIQRLRTTFAPLVLICKPIALVSEGTAPPHYWLENHSKYLMMRHALVSRIPTCAGLDRVAKLVVGPLQTPAMPPFSLDHPSATSTANTVVLIACCSRKLDRAAPARELYQGALFKFSMAYCQQHGLRWAILSAKYGLIWPDEVAEPYETRLSSRRADQVFWAERVFDSLQRGRLPKRVVFLAGEDYRRELTKRLVAAGVECHAPLAGLGIGLQLGRMKGLTAR